MPTDLAVVERLVKSLPGFDAEEMPDRARAALACVLDRILNIDLSQPIPMKFDPAACPNCGIRVDSTRSPYCGSECREFSSFVRQFRSGIAEGSIFEAARQEAIGQVLWHLLGGGRPLREHLIPERSRSQILTKDAGLCRLCGAPATTVEHIATGCNRPINLQSVCAACSRTRPFGDPQLLAEPKVKELIDEFALRIGSPCPLRCCDDAATWDWREYLTKRQAANTLT